MNEHISPDDYLDDRLTPPEKQAADRHMAACADCRAGVAETRALRSWMKEIPALTPPESFYAQVLRRAKEPARRRRSLWRFYALPGLATAAAAVLVLIVVREAPDRRAQKGFHVGQEVDLLAPIDGPHQAPAADEKKRDASHGALATAPGALKDAAEGVGGLAGAYALSEKRVPHYPAEEQARQNERAAAPQKSANPASPPPTPIVVPTGQRLDDRSLLLRKEKQASKAEAVEKEVANEILQAKKLPSSMDKVGKPTTSGQKPLESDADAGALKNPDAPEWRGRASAIRTPETVVIRDQKSWEAFLQRHQGPPARNLQSGFVPSYPAAPDFSRLQAVAVFAGEKNTGGYAVEILRIEETPREINVIYREIAPPANAMTTQALTQPFHIKFIPKDPRPVVFKKIP